MIQFLPNTRTLVLEYEDIVPDLMSYDSLKKYVQRGTIIRERRGCNGTTALYNYDSLPPKYQAMYVQRAGDPYKRMRNLPLLSLIRPDYEAQVYYAEEYRLPNDQPLPIHYQQRYCRQSEWLNMIAHVTEDKRTLKDTLRIDMEGFWRLVIELHQTDEPINPKLPKSRERLTKKLNRYRDEGYNSLVEAHRFDNNNARIVTQDIEGLLLSLYAKRHCRATLKEVCDDYNAFMRGEIMPVDLTTGEVFSPDDYLVKGQRFELSLAAVKYYLNTKKNREKIDALKLSGHDFQQKHAPHNRRKSAEYAFSKISMDDYLPPFKTPDGKRQVWVYAIFDVASRAIVGIAYGTKKSAALVDEALRDMLRTCVRNGWGIPMEVELERSLNWQRRGSEEQPDIFTNSHVFPFVRFTKGNNSQEKRAEHFLNSFKYEQLADLEGFLGRPHGRNENFRLNRDKAEARYQVNALVSAIKKLVTTYNNEKHHSEKSLTRWQYLQQRQNPQAIQNHPSLIMPYIGFRTETSIRRQDVRVQNNYYAISTDTVRAAGGVAEVVAYWIPGENGEAPEQVYVYQNGRYIGEGQIIEQYQEALAERTDRDWQLLGQQSGRQRAFEQKILDGAGEIRLLGTVQAEEEPDGVVRVGLSYDKLAQEEEEYELVMGVESPDFSTKNGSSEGGFMQENGGFDADSDSIESIIKRAKSSL